MMNRPTHTCAAVPLALILASVLVNADQVSRRPVGESAQVPMDVSLKVGGGSYAVNAPGSCTHAPVASIYGVVSEMWMARQASGGQSVQLTLWKPKDGSEPMFTISVNGTSSTSVTTVRNQVSGSGKVTLAPAAKGGMFTIEAKAKTGDAITGTIKCEAFTAAIAEGGH